MDMVKYIIPAWCLLVVLMLCGFLCWHGKYRFLLGWKWGLGIIVALVFPALPLHYVVDSVWHVPIQTVYRFDEHRRLDLKGVGCEGSLRYIDTKKEINSEVTHAFFRISFFTYIHPSENYIAIPWGDLSGFIMSTDGGRSFDKTPWGGGARFSDVRRPNKEDVKSFTVVGDRGFLLTKDNRLYISGLPEKEPGNWGGLYVEVASLLERRTTLSDVPWFTNPPTSVPEVKNYKGWDRMRCDPDLPAVEIPNGMDELQLRVLNIQKYTLGLPVMLVLDWLGFKQAPLAEWKPGIVNFDARKLPVDEP